VQGLSAMKEADLIGCKVPTLMVWGGKDYSHRWTDKETLRDCGHFPELEQTDRYLELLGQSGNP